jgi:galactose oxidase-like protein
MGKLGGRWTGVALGVLVIGCSVDPPPTGARALGLPAERGSWTRIGGPPDLRFGHAIVYDHARDRVVLFGGRGPTGRTLDDTWEYDPAIERWAPITTTGTTPDSRPTRVAHAMVYDARRGRIILFGGNDGTGILGDTWEYEGTAAAWTKLRTNGSPPARVAHQMVYDTARGRTILFGGHSATGDLGDTWEYDGVTATWTQIGTSTTGPPARSLHAMAYDRARDRTIVFGGGDSRGQFGDTWEYDAAQARWTQVASTGTPAGSPFVRLQPAMVYDEVRARPFLFGGYDVISGDPADAWEFDSATATWIRAPGPSGPPGRVGHAMAYDGARGRAILFGGSGGDGLLADTWARDSAASAWIRIGLPGRYGHAMAHDSGRGRTIIFGGAEAYDNFLGDTWEYDLPSASWSAIATSSSPTSRTEHAMAYDSARARVVLFGGKSLPLDPLTQEPRYLDDTWEYDGLSWSHVRTHGSPLHRSGHAMVFDTTRARIVLFGGHADDDLADTWEYDGARASWTQVPTTTTASSAPSARQYHAMAFDGARGRTILFGGLFATRTNPVLLGDTWEYDGARWTRVTTSTHPADRAGAAMVYDDDARHAILFGGGTEQGTNPAGAETWHFDGTPPFWTSIATTRSPLARELHAMAYAGAAARVVLFGGTLGGALGDTWEYCADACPPRPDAGTADAAVADAPAIDTGRLDGDASDAGAGFDGAAPVDASGGQDGGALGARLDASSDGGPTEGRAASAGCGCNLSGERRPVHSALLFVFVALLLRCRGPRARRASASY